MGLPSIQVPDFRDPVTPNAYVTPEPGVTPTVDDARVEDKNVERLAGLRSSDIGFPRACGKRYDQQ
jgi:hypothetical protein